MANEQKISEHIQCPHCMFQHTEEHEEMNVGDNTVQGWCAGKVSDPFECYECEQLITTRMAEGSEELVIVEVAEEY